MGPNDTNSTESFDEKDMTPEEYGRGDLITRLAEAEGRDNDAAIEPQPSFEDNLEKLRAAALGEDPTRDETIAFIKAATEASDEAIPVLSEEGGEDMLAPPPPPTPTVADFFLLARAAFKHAHDAKGGGNVKTWIEAAVGFAKVSGDIVESREWREDRTTAMAEEVKVS